MGDATLETLIPKTQELLQPLITKPKLADKLLAKPPFRFLHDIFAALTLATGFGKGLYNDFESDSANIKEKNQKTAYLDKMIVCVGFALSKDVDVRSAKIVAGLEAENTNIFLQDLARTASNSALDWIKAVQKTLEKVPSLTPEGGSAIIPMAGAVPAAEAKSSEGGSSRPSSKEKSSTPSDADKAAAAEAKAKERAKREQQAEAAAEKKEKEKTAELQRQDSETVRAKAEAKAETASAAARKKTPSQPDNNETDDAVQQQVRECNGDFEKTKDVVEKIIAKPKMAVKLLSKPPFRFLHDIFSEITRVTGFADGLYGAEELDSSAIKEKQPKIDYLAKIIACVSVHLNVEVDAKPAKIVAGLEPEETNKFLQLLAVACRHGSSADAVQRVLAGDTTLRAVSATAKKPSSSSNKSGGDREATPEAKLSSRSTTPQESKSREKEAKDPSPAAAVAPGGFVASAPMKAAHDDNDDDGGNSNLRFPSSTTDAKENDGDDGGSGSQQAPGTSGGFGTSRTSRPTTARRRPPKLKENVTEVGRMLVADTKIAAVAGIMKDGDNADSDDDGDNNDSNGSSSRNGSRPTSSSSLPHHGDDGSQHGRLVREILKNEEAARKEREDDDAKESAGGPTLESETGIRLGRRKKSFKDKAGKGSAASSATEMNELRGNIQKICQATLPMGKAIEFVHDDLDAMAKELDKWKKEYATKCGLYEDEKKKTDEALQPLQVALLEVEEQIKEQAHKINTLKGTIAKNDEKTQKLLRMVVSA